MTQSSDRQRKQPLPVPPPLTLKTAPQGVTDIDDDDETNILPDDSITSSRIKSHSSQTFDVPNFDEDDDDNFESEEKTQINTLGMLPPLNNQGKIPPLTPPPLSSPPRSPLNNKNILSKSPNNLRSEAGVLLSNSPPAFAKVTAKPGETDVRKGSVMSNRTPAPAPATLRAGPQGGVNPSNQPTRRSPGQPSLHELVQLAYDNSYSDVHLGVGEFPRMRDRGEIMTLEEYPEIDLNTFMSWLQEILREDEIQRFKKELEFDGATQYDFARVRINVFDTLRGPALVLRLIPLKILTLEQLKLPPIFRDICDAHKGLILVTGPTGSGKSTTLAAMVDHINSECAKHIITIEDPVEFVHKSRKSLIKQREVGMHTLKFDNALKASLREDPDIILVGEMRDKETVNTALKAAQTGHLVMGTLHTNSAVKTLERIFTLYSAEEQPAMRSAIAESLVGIIAQGLCRTTDGKRAAFHDILINTETVKDYILNNKYEEIGMLMIDGEFDGMITMNKSLFELYQEGRITEETALEMSPTRNEMAMMLRGRV